MNRTPSSVEVVTRSVLWDWTQRLADPKSASGQCYLTTERILEYFDWSEGMQVAFARHHNDPRGRWMELGQYSNHYAIYLPQERLVVDLTLRQFAPKSAWPWVGTYSQWLRILVRAWDVPSVKHLTRTRGLLCFECAQVNCNMLDCPGVSDD